MSNYPKVMTHPNAMKSQITKIVNTDAAGRQVVDYSGTADKFPPVTVTNEDQEARHRAQGYLTAEDQIEKQQYEDYPVWLKHEETGEAVLATGAEMEEEYASQGYSRPIAADPEAVERAYASPYVPGQVTQEWPKMVDGKLVQDPSFDPTKPLEYPKWVHHPDRSKSELDVCVNTPEEERAVRARFGLSAPKAEESSEEVAPVSEEDPVRAKLLSLADLEGIEVDPEWTNAQLKQAILGQPASEEPEEEPSQEEEEIDLNEINDKDRLLEIAAQWRVAVDKRWSVAKIRAALLKKAA